jgi:O-antigen/teichoic acid export membrane protein
MPRRTLATGAAIASVGLVASALIGGLLGVVIARLLGPAGTGAYNVVMSSFAILSLVASLGISVGASFYVAGGNWSPSLAYRQVQVAALGLGLVGAALGFVLFEFGRDTAFNGVTTEDALVALCALPFALSWSFSTGLALALDRHEIYALAPVVVNALALLLTLVFAPSWGVTGAVAAFAVANGAGAAVSLVLVGQRVRGRAPGAWSRNLFPILRRAAAFGSRSQVTQIMQLVQQRADLFILNAFVGGAAVGHYAVALALTELGLLLPRALAAAVVPRLAGITADESLSGDPGFTTLKSIRHTLLSALPTSVLLAAGAFLIPVVFGSDFESSTTLALLLIPGGVAAGLTYAFSATLIGHGRPDLVARAAFIATPAALVLYAILIPLLETIGAALASSMAYTLTASLTAWYFAGIVSRRPIRIYLPTRDELDDYRVLAWRLRR